MKKFNLALVLIGLALIGVMALVWWTWNGMLKVDADTCRVWAYVVTILCVGLPILTYLWGMKNGRLESKGAKWGLDRGTEHVAQTFRAITGAAREERISAKEAAQAPAATALPVMPVIHRIESGGPVEI